MDEIKIKQTRTELHTHLMGMLSAKEMLNMVSDYLSEVYWPISKSIDENSTYISTKDLYKSVDAINALSIPQGSQENYDVGLKDIYTNRNQLINFIISQISITKSIPENIVEEKIYNDYFNRSIKELIDQGVQYTEISYSNIDRISKFKLKEEYKDKIKYIFLLSSNRFNKVGPARIKELENAINNNLSIGYDFMGKETPLVDAELRETGRESYYRKIDAVLKELVKSNNSVLRIHSGEAIGTEENTEKIFRIIDKIKENNGYSNFPPPELRIGHGVHYNKSEYYYKFLKDNNVIVEINASSNYALSNIGDLDDLPYLDYLEHNIPIVLSTDGHGAYNTSILLEDKKALLYFLKNRCGAGYEYVTKLDESIREEKMR